MYLKSKIESILFVTGGPVSLAKLAKVLEEPEEKIADALSGLSADYENRGLNILRKEDEFQFGTNPANAELIEKLVKSEFTEDLTKAALETLTIIAYKGPLTRSEIEFIRGVNTSFTVRNLLLRGLIERIENPKDARSYIYKISFDFLKYLGVTSVDELPGYRELQHKTEEVIQGNMNHAT
ncbi:MAG: SMC-Scp complex subunit ScpB [Candidatus Sungbacteria bacterium RIFCSPLOWO2_12_FULL_41_11]|uniref:SMC-Scp complex subunit ScpB n=1 Tax=Candidatus Sungbacteria bacterium RIFCSPLOWO2_12_FULL_41_11 TaxID=1802286 RepID=A0A1G2LU95_9BACT|nr:MAG: SMC-Scp complex subunit ScpB [Candidatus Sungbacteria bacterium RIFCSPHIGHO2_02_FULL_41_12b]OHA14391.1 MAG: SMC-Scp complex subunit ScpB [Candidatus Sungbacteria bacterium RIFCSPLOWO2_12_FULL_41_11]